MKKYTAIVVEDELLPRLSLLEKLKNYHSDIEVIAECETAESALQETLRRKPQILFLDIQLSDHTSLWLIEQLQNTTAKPFLIFTTAYSDSEYLIKAIKFDTIDYLLKPVNIIELAKSIKKAKDKIDSENNQIETTIDILKNKPFIFKTLHSELRITANYIFYFVADGNYCDLYLSSGEREAIFERMGAIEEKLAGSCVIRAGKSHLINTQYIYKIDFKRKQCILKSPYTQLAVNLSDTGMMILKNL